MLDAIKNEQPLDRIVALEAEKMAMKVDNFPIQQSAIKRHYKLVIMILFAKKTFTC